MPKLTARPALFALIIGHVAGMIDLAALPIWIDTLIGGYGYRPALAGLMPTTFLLGAVAASLLLSWVFARANRRVIAPLGYWIASAALLAMTQISGLAAHLALHLVAGLATGTALSIVHGTIGRSANPHRTFSYAGIGFGVFSLVFLGGVPQLVSAFGPQAFFYAVAATMAVAALAATLFLPADARPITPEPGTPQTPFTTPVRLAIAGIMGMALVQGMVFSFLVQVGNARGFGPHRVELVLIVLGLVNLVPPALAAVLQNRLNPMGVARVGPLIQGLFALSIMAAPAFLGYALPAVLFAAVLIFTHTFVFGFIARHEPSGRAVAATPAMLMTGSAVAPFLGGALVELSGFAAIGVASVLVALICTGLFARARSAARAAPSGLPAE